MENIKELFAEWGLWSLVEDISDDGDGTGDNLQLTKEGSEAQRMIDQELDKAREEGRREGDIASDFLYWHPLGGGMPDSSIRIGVEFEVGGCYEDWGFVIEENGKPISSGRTLKEAIDKLKTKEDEK